MDLWVHGTGKERDNWLGMKMGERVEDKSRACTGLGGESGRVGGWWMEGWVKILMRGWMDSMWVSI